MSKNASKVEMEKESNGLQSLLERPFYSIADLAARWRCSRGTVYNVLRGEKVLDFAAPGHKGRKLVSVEVVRHIERENVRIFR